MKTPEYEIFHHPRLDDLILDVNSRLSDGWRPLGQPFVLPVITTEGFQMVEIAQTMTRFMPESE